MPVRRLVAAITVAATVLAGCSGGKAKAIRIDPTTTSSEAASTSTSAPAPTTTAAPATTTTAAVPPLNWVACGGGFECATARPPLDWDHPDGRTAQLAVVRLRASGPASQRIGSLFVNPGGPGASAVDFAKAARGYLRPSVLARFDVIGFDPRGTGQSQPITCEAGPDMDRYFAVDPTPDNAAERQALIDANRAFADQCFARNGDFLAHVDTRTVARDMDFIRQSLGEDKLTYLGYSYGTFIGAMYADLFPSHVRAAALDGAMDPAISVDQTNRDQAAGFEKAFDAFLADCAANPTCALRADGDPRAVFDSLNARIDAQPIPVGSRSVGPGELFLAVVSALYRRSDWPGLSRALHAAVASGNASSLLAMSDEYTQRRSDGSYGTLLSANAAVNCIDRPWSKVLSDYDKDAQEFSAESPEFGAALAYGGLACAFWRVPAVDEARPLKAAGAPPIVVVGTTDDPATPYKWAQALASELQSGVLLTHVGEGHTSFGSPSACVTSAVTNYLVDLTVPAKGASC